MMGDRLALAAVVLGVLAVPGACSNDPEPPAPGGETHWLGTCARDSDCAQGRCLCNVCTESCSGDSECAAGETEAACFDTASPGLTTRCEPAALGSGPGLCLALCDVRDDCPGDSAAECLLGACVPPVPRAEDGSTPDEPARSPRPSTNDYAHVDAAMDFTEPVELPPPRTVIRGAEDWLEGTWAELNLAGEPCTPDAPGPIVAGNACLHLEVERSATGELVGHIRWLSSGSSRVNGPFPPPTDPAAGYPVGVPPDQYFYLFGPVSHVRYRVLDAVLTGERLSFWASSTDLWTDWCRMQTPHSVRIDGREQQRCVPDGADETDTDLGKLALCTSMYDSGDCEDRFGIRLPCACIQDGSADIGLPLCTRAACACTASGCEPNLRESAFLIDLDVRGDRLRGTVEADWSTYSIEPIELVKVEG